VTAPDLSARWAALLAGGRVRWMPGMRARVRVPGSPWWRISDGTAHTGIMDTDFDDAATLGCLLAPVRERWGEPGLYVQHRGGISASVPAWVIKTDEHPCGYGSGHWTGHTEAEALTAALEAAPKGGE
jgi:hypothetical protein